MWTTNQARDVLTEINTVNIERLHIFEVRKMLLGLTGSSVTLRFKPPNQVPYEVELVRRASHEGGGRDDDASERSIAAEQVGIGMRMTNDAPFSVVSLVPGGAAALSGEIKAKVRCSERGMETHI